MKVSVLRREAVTVCGKTVMVPLSAGLVVPPGLAGVADLDDGDDDAAGSTVTCGDDVRAAGSALYPDCSATVKMA